MVAPGLCTPRVDMQAWLASITTPTPLGCNTWSRVVAMSEVIFS